MSTAITNCVGQTREEREAELRRMAPGFVIYQLYWYEPGATFIGVTDEQAIERVLRYEFVERRERRIQRSS